MDAGKLGQFIAQRRKELGLTQATLAEKLNVTDKAVSRWERAVGLPDIGSMEALAQALEVDLVELMCAERIEQPHISRAEAEELLTEALHLSERPATAWLARGLLAVFAVLALPLLPMLFRYGSVAMCNVGSILLGLGAWTIPLTRLARVRIGGSAGGYLVSFSLALLSLTLQFFEIKLRVDAGDWSALMDTVPALCMVVVLFSAVTMLLHIAAARLEKHRSKRLGVQEM
ncbi:MAG: helix-turn-helix transcriptional regulator [Oscillospiraceae bacterium]|nr:helix-turn-helix transcriptional regulator [Oscillospiraceae bacterium]